MLYLVRHGEAKSSKEDPQRSLTRRGKQEIDLLAIQLKAKKCNPAIILHSQKIRAQETANILAKQLCPKQCEIRDTLTPSADPYPWIDILSELNEDTMIVSHLPFLGHLLYGLTQSTDVYNSTQFSTGTTVKLTKPKRLWQLDWIESPNL